MVYTLAIGRFFIWRSLESIAAQESYVSFLGHIYYKSRQYGLENTQDAPYRLLMVPIYGIWALISPIGSKPDQET